jgi:hypothetical protein
MSQAKQNLKETQVSASEKQGGGNILQNLKIGTFEVLNLLLKNESEEIIYFSVQTIIDYIQMLGFIFDAKINPVWKANSLLLRVFDFFDFFDLKQYFSSAFNWTTYLIYFYAQIAVIVFVVADIVYVYLK